MTNTSARALWIVLCSALLASAALVAALWLTRPADGTAFGAEVMVGNTPERAAESFIEAHRSGAFTRAAHFATGKLAETLAARAKTPSSERAQFEHEHEQFVVHESHRLEGQRLRLQGVLVPDDRAESEGKSVVLTLRRLNGRYLVEEITW